MMYPKTSLVFLHSGHHEPLGGSWVLINRVISRVTILINHIRGHITPLITTLEPPSRALTSCALSMVVHAEKPTFSSEVLHLMGVSENMDLNIVP